ncbi:MAG TPA: lysine--tRNA ligase [Solirubrobacteraceae bacterium]|nr:lysine--tRNA ligase [Solirubrobacteraceae bacterium]
MGASEQPPAAAEPGRHGLQELIQERRAKAQRLRESDPQDFPYEFPGAEPIEAVQAEYAGLATGEETDDHHRVAGRILAIRRGGRSGFLDLVDRTGKIQLHARQDVLGKDAFKRLTTLDSGDLIGVDGAPLRSRHGELTLRVDSFRVLAKALRPPPEKHHGLSDVETRLRRRELDLIANESTRRLFVDRARIISAVRGYLDESGFVEVETPVLQPLYGGALARPFTTHHNALDRDLYLRIATELYLKRLLVGGLERVYELGKDFRNEGVSTKHNPEFTMVEWYEAYADYRREAERLQELVARAAAGVGYEGELDFASPWRQVTFFDAVKEATGIELGTDRDAAALASEITRRGLEVKTEGAGWAQMADDLLSKYVEPTLVQPSFVFDYPVELSPFARAHRDQPGLVERWEAFAGGVEIANAFSELTDPDVQRERFEAQVRLHEQGDQESQPYDEAFVEALEQGMPPAGGVGLGIDRLVMLLTGRDSIREVVLFPALRN